MASSESDMDWGLPCVPGSWPTAPRTTKKRTASEAGLKEIPVVVGRDTTKMDESVSGTETEDRSWATKAGAALLERTWKALAATGSMVYRVTRNSISGAAQLQKVVEIRRFTNYGYESVKRRATDIIRPSMPTPQEVARNIMPIGGVEHQTARNRVDRTQQNMVGLSHYQGTVMQFSVNSHANGLAVSNDMTSSNGLVELPASHLLSSIKAPPQATSTHNRHQEGSSLNHNASLRLSAEETAAYIGFLRPKPIQGLDLAPTPFPAQRPLQVKDYSKIRGPIKQEKFVSGRHDISTRLAKKSQSQLSKFSTNTYDAGHLPKKVLIDNSVPSMRQVLTQGTSGDVRRIQKSPVHNQPMNKQVRIALNPMNGLPKEYIGKFLRGSHVGQWEPSSPWAQEQASRTARDLRGQLESLMDNVSGSPVPPSTPLRRHAIQYPESIAPGEVPNYHLEPNRIFTPQDNEIQHSYSTLDQVVRSMGGQLSASSKTESQTIRNAGAKDSNLQIPLHTSPAVYSTPLPILATQLSETPGPPRISSCYRVMERCVKDVRQALFLSPSPSRNTVQPATTDAYQIPMSSSNIEVQESVDASFETTDAAPLQTESHEFLTSLGPPLILGLKPLFNLAESRSEIREPSAENVQSLYGTSGEQDKAETANISPESRDTTLEISSTLTNSGEAIKHEEKMMSISDNGITSDRERDVFLELAMSEMGMSDLIYEKRKRTREAKDAARRKKREEEEAAAKAKEEAEEKARFQRRPPKQKLVQPLNIAWEKKLAEALSKSGQAVVATTSNGTDLKHHDLASVVGETRWLNDEIINGYIDWVVDYANKKVGIRGNATPRVVAQNSFFYDKLSKEGPASVSRWMKRKKASGAKLLEVETVLIPVNNAAHWTLLVVSPKSRTIEYLDSYGAKGTKMVSNAKAWLKVELGTSWDESEWRVLDTTSAEQFNGYDCGVFVATNAECVVGGVDTFSYSGEDMAAQRRRIAGVLLNNGFGGDFIPAQDL